MVGQRAYHLGAFKVDLFCNVSITVHSRVHQYCSVNYNSFWTFICQTILLCNKDIYMNNKMGNS